MTNMNPAGSNHPLRGEVAKRFREVSVLAGFMDEAHFGAFAQEFLSTLSDPDKVSFLQAVQNARIHLATLPAMADFAAEIKPVDAADVSALIAQERFSEIFGASGYRFSWVDPKKLVAVQAFVNVQQEEVPLDEAGLLEYALPTDWSVPVELSFIPPLGPIYVVTSSTHLAGVQIRTDAETGNIIIQPPPHANLVQVLQVGGRYYLRNGYHRVAGALSEGVGSIPALVVDAVQPSDVGIPTLGWGGFNGVYLAGLQRPPLVSDFKGPISVQIRMREKRYGASVSLQISPLNIGV